MKKLPWGAFISELIGTGILILVGLSFVILDFGNGSPVVRLLPDPGLRRLITGFLFGSTGALIAFSWVGKVSGAHINPVVTLAFWLRGKFDGKIALGYVFSQLIGAILGSLPLIAWGQIGKSVNYGATLPGQAYGPGWAVAGELITTFCLIIGLFLFLGHKPLRNFTPLLFPFLYAVMVFLEAPVSGTSTNPARSLGPALISGEWQYWWVYWVGPILGTLLALSLQRVPWFRRFEIEVAKIYHFEHDPFGIFGLEEELEEDIKEIEESF
jgi:aquaporin Z